MKKYKIIYNNNFHGDAALLNQGMEYGQDVNQDINPFYLYTTGIVNWGSFESDGQNLIKIWNNGLIDFILSKIPNNFYIVIKHYDPLLEIGDENPMKLDDSLIYVSENLIPADEIHPRILETSFFPERLNIDEFQGIDVPYLILDFAHIFNHTNIPNRVYIAGHYQEGVSEPIQLNVLRSGFIGNGFGRDFTFSDNFRIDINGEVNTYINKLIELGIEFSPQVPEDIIEKIFNDVNRSFERKIKKLKNDALFFKIEHIIKEVKPSNKDILDSIMLRLWNNMPIDQIVEEVSNYYISKNIDRITKLNPIP